MSVKSIAPESPQFDAVSRARPPDREPVRSDLSQSVENPRTTLAFPDALEWEASIALRLDGDAMAQAQNRQLQRGATAELEALFFSNFAERAADAEGFHAMMRTAFGAGYDRDVAEVLRIRTLRGDRSWLPNVAWNDHESMNGGLGAFDSKSGTVYLSENLLEDPMLALAVYAEEVGHAIDERVNPADTVGDEGEIFRRLLSGEVLGAKELASLRAENDHGVITVDGKQIKVEFFIGKIRKGVKRVWGGAKKAVGRAGKKVVSGLTRAGDGVFRFLQDSGSAVGQLLRGRPGEAIDRFARGVHSLGLGVFDGIAELVDAPLELLGPLRKPLKRLKRRVFDALRPLVEGGLGVVLGLVRGGSEGLLRIARGVGELARGRFKSAAESLGKGMLQTFVKTPTNAAILSAGKTVSAIQTLLGAEPPGRSLTEEEIAAAREVFGDSIDYDAVRIKEGDAGLFSLPNDRPFVFGNTIYLKERAVLRDFSEGSEAYLAAKGLFIHEMMHVWQYQNGGSDYIAESLYGQYFGHEYDWEISVPQTPWDELEVEQQAKMLEHAVIAGFFDGKNRFVHGGVDYTEYLKRYLRDLRRGRRAP